MNGQSLEEVTSYRDLGVIMSSHLKVTVRKLIAKPTECYVWLKERLSIGILGSW